MDIKVRITGDEARISAPSDVDFSNEMKYHNCKFDMKTNEWVVDIDLLDIVRKKLYNLYGMDDFTNDFVNVWVTIPEYHHLEELRGPVKMFGKVIATATSKTSGAFWGKDIVNMSSECDSFGSLKNWKTYVSCGRFKIKNVSKTRILEEKEMYEEDGFIIEILESSKVNKKVLLEERARLIERINEIDKTLQEESDSIMDSKIANDEADFPD
ncbi:hypothetical protein SAMN05660648_02750 [Selenomonas ruminantium]|uniref:Uncharacterized protein n=2 Tax=Selenomonas ruminantium TaxID=971 RepID=A0A1H4A6V7_SELRU|nr:hypothetical protein SAMN05660648_02750 [Selenomonas ruminantium]